MNTIAVLVEALIVVAIILVSLSVHEFAHAFVANMFGDPTAKLEGRMTLNPFAHWDRFGTTLLVLLIIVNAFGVPVPIFGWGKPVPIDERNFSNPRWHGFQAAIAGPMSNFIFAILLALLLRLFSHSLFIVEILTMAIGINIFLMFFNLIPVPPLDGSRILRLVLPDEAYIALISNPVILMGLLFVIIFFFLDPIARESVKLSSLLINY